MGHTIEAAPRAGGHRAWRVGRSVLRPATRPKALEPSRRTPSRLSLATVALVGGPIVALAGVASAAVQPEVVFFRRAPGVALLLETVVAMVALLVSFLTFGRYRVSRSTPDLLAAFASAVMAISAFLLAALPLAAGATALSPELLWSRSVVRAAVAAALALSAFRLRSVAVMARRSPALLIVVSGFTVVGASALLVLAVVDRLPTLAVLMRPDMPLARGPVLYTALNAVAALGFLVAAAVFAVRARAEDELFGWWSAAGWLGAVSHMANVLQGGDTSELVLHSDVLRLLFFLALLAGAVEEIHRFWGRSAELAVLEERRRIARELHDGVAQELAFLATHSKLLAEPDGTAKPAVGEVASLLASSAQRALDESRRAITALTAVADRPFVTMLTDEVEEVGRRSGLRVKVFTTATVELAGQDAENLLRIVREAATNAVRHADATCIYLRVLAGPRVRICLSDDGVGFDVARARREGRGFGLQSMEDRAAAVGATLSILSMPRNGATVQVELP